MGFQKVYAQAKSFRCMEFHQTVHQRVNVNIVELYYNPHPLLHYRPSHDAKGHSLCSASQFHGA